MEPHPVKAIIPAAGMGTRLQPATLVVPKELLPVGRKPMIQLAVEEALASGIKEIGIVIRKGKEAIQRHFEALMASSDPAYEAYRRDFSKAHLRFIFQKECLGLGNAIYESGSFIDDSPFIMIIPDQFIRSSVPATSQLLGAVYRDFEAVWSSLITIAQEDSELFPGARKFELTNRVGNTWSVTGIREDSGNADEQPLVGFGRTFFPAHVVDFFSNSYLNPASGEVDLLLSFRALMKAHRNYAVLLEGKAMDFGTWPGYEYFSSNLHVSLPGKSKGIG